MFSDVLPPFLLSPSLVTILHPTAFRYTPTQISCVMLPDSIDSLSFSGSLFPGQDPKEASRVVYSSSAHKHAAIRW